MNFSKLGVEFDTSSVSVYIYPEKHINTVCNMMFSGLTDFDFTHNKIVKTFKVMGDFIHQEPIYQMHQHNGYSTLL